MKKYRPLWLALLALGLFIALVVYRFEQAMRIDACLSEGGSYSDSRHTCDLPSHPTH